MKCYLWQGSHVEEEGKISWQNPLSSTKRFSVGNFEPDIPNSVGKSQAHFPGSFTRARKKCHHVYGTQCHSQMNKHGDARDINVPWDAKYANYSLGNRKKGKSSLKHYSPNLFPLKSQNRVGLTADVCRFLFAWGYFVDKQTLLSFCLMFV